MLSSKKDIFKTRSLVDAIDGGGGIGGEEHNCVTLNSITAYTQDPSYLVITVEYRRCSDGVIVQREFHHGESSTQSVGACIVEGSLDSSAPGRTSYSMETGSCGIWGGIETMPPIFDVVYGANSLAAACTESNLVNVSVITNRMGTVISFSVATDYADFSEVPGYAVGTNDYFYYPTDGKWYQLNPDGTIISSGTCPI